MAASLIIPPAVEPVTLQEVKDHLRIVIADDDTILAFTIQSAREHVEDMISRALITQTWELVLNRFPSIIDLPYPPLQTVASIVYIDSDGLQQTLDPSVYAVDTKNTPGRVRPAYDQSWPATRKDINTVTITYTAGYGNATTDVPGPIRSALLLLIGHLYENREATAPFQITNLPLGVDRLLAPYRMITF